MSSWPSAGERVLDELRTYPGRLGLISNDDAASAATRAFALLLGSEPLNVSRAIVQESIPSTPEEVAQRVATGRVLIALDVLFWRPWLHLDPLRLLRSLSRNCPPVLAVWPGAILGSQITYSATGRRDFYEATLEDALVLRPRAVTYPDEVPYELERR
jgi:hypothetical protein